jgi:hypothetical protein
MHSSGDGDVLSSQAPTTSVMVLQCPGREHSVGDGRTGPELAEETRSTSPTSRCCLVRARGRRPYPFFEGSAVLFRGVRRAGRTGVGGTVSRS